MRLIFFGSGAFGLPTLQRLVDAHDVALVVSQPDRPAGRHRQLTPTPIAGFAQSRGLSAIKPVLVNDQSVVDQIRSIKADALVVIAFGQKLGRELLNGTFAINLHASLLPKFRGAAPINWAMINGDTETGISVITLADRMDAGDVLGQASTSIEPLETAGELHDRLAAMGPDLIANVLQQHGRGELQSQPQDESQATQAPKLSKVEGTVRFDQPALRVRQRVHGLTPWPGCSIQIDSRALRIHRVDIADRRTEHDQPGLVLSDHTIACSAGSIRLLEVQPPGGKLMPFASYCNGQPVKPGMKAGPA